MSKASKENLKQYSWFIIILSMALALMVGIFFPDIFSPEVKAGLIFKETRQWQIASDVADVEEFIIDTASTTWTVPADWTASNSVEVIGGGGGGYGGSLTSGAGGGGGGAYAKTLNIAILTPGNDLTVKIGTGGATGTNGGDTAFCSTTASCASSTDANVLAGAQGGRGATGATGATRGASTTDSSIGEVRQAGGTGGTGNGTADSGGGGGGAGGPLGEGGNGGNGSATGTAGAQVGAGGGGNGGGQNALSATTQSTIGTQGGHGNAGVGGGAGGNASSGDAGGVNTGGGGGGGEDTFSGGNGAADNEWGTYGSGGGGGGSGDPDDANDTGGDGGLYGGGGGGGGGMRGVGAQGIIRIVYTPNNAPSTTTVTEDDPDSVTQGDPVTFSATSTDAESDNWWLAICKTDAITAGTGGGAPSCSSEANTYCTSSSAVASGAKNTCQWTSSDTGAQTWYAFVCDANALVTQKCSGSESSTITVNVANQAPTVATPVLYGGNAISLTASTTQQVYATTTITDTNTYTDIATVTAVFYNTTSTKADGQSTNADGYACAADENLCYTGASIVSCDWISAGSGDTRDASCTADFWFDAVPTDAGNWSTTMGWTTTTWEVWFQAADAANATGSATTTQEVNTLSGLEALEIGIDYGTVNVGATSTTGKSITINTTGNCPINTNISGVNMESSAYTIGIENQRYATSGDLGWDNLGWTASTTVQLLNLDSGKTTSRSSPESDTVYWGIFIPSGTMPLSYNGTNTIAVVEDTVDW